MVEIIGMLVMADQHRVDRPDPVGAQRRAGSLGQGDVAQLVLAGCVEGGIGDQAESVRLDQHGRPSYEGRGQCAVIASPRAWSRKSDEIMRPNRRAWHHISMWGPRPHAPLWPHRNALSYVRRKSATAARE